jgi:hypothetical protein
MVTAAVNMSVKTRDSNNEAGPDRQFDSLMISISRRA